MQISTPACCKPHLLSWLIGSAALCLCLLFLSGCCGYRVKARTNSPDNVPVATVYEVDCGATTDYATQVSVSRPSDNYKDRDGILFIVKGQKNVNVKWTGDRSLYVECDGCFAKAIFFENVRRGGLGVTYALAEPQK